MKTRDPIRAARAAAAGLLAALTAAAAPAPDRPVRLASLAPSLTELAFALGLGSNLVARSSACDFPPAAQALPVAGDFGRPFLEATIRLRPDAVLATDLEKPALRDALARQGIALHLLPCNSWAQLEEAARELARLAGAPAAGAAWAADFAGRRAELARRVEARRAGRPRPRVFVELWGDPLTTCGANSFLYEVVRTAGGDPLGAELRQDFAHVNAEWVIAARPDALLLAYMPASAAPADDALRRRVGWADLPALRRGAVCRDIPSDLLLRPGPRLLDGAERLAAWLESLPAGP